MSMSTIRYGNDRVDVSGPPGPTSPQPSIRSLAAIVGAVLAAAAICYFAFVAIRHSIKQTEELTATRAEVVSLHADLSVMKETLAMMSGQLSKADADTAATKREVATIKVSAIGSGPVRPESDGYPAKKKR